MKHIVVFVLFMSGCSLIAAQTCSLPVSNTTNVVVMPNFALNISDPYELTVSSSVVLKSNESVVLREHMNFLEWGSGKLVDIECHSTTGECVKRWIFDEKNWLTSLMKDTTCDWYNAGDANFSINVLVGGAVYYDNTAKSNRIISGYKQLLNSFAGLNATKLSLNLSEQAFAFDFGVQEVSQYTLCSEFPQLNTTGTVDLFVVENAVGEVKDIVGADKPYMVRISLKNVDKGILINNSKSGEMIDATLTLRATYHKPPFTRTRSPSEMVIPLDVYCPFPSSDKNMTLPIQKNLHVVIEESLDEDKAMIIRDERINFDAKLVRRSFVIPDDQAKKNKLIYTLYDKWMTGYAGDATIHLIHDYNYGVEWAVYPVADKCYLRQIPAESPEASPIVNSTNVKMDKDLLGILNLDSTGFTYYGESRHRSLPVSVFGAKKTDFLVNGTTAVIKLFIASSNWSMDTVDTAIKSPLVGVQIFMSNGKNSYRYKANIVQVEVDQAPDFWLGDDFRSCASDVPAYSMSFNDSGSSSVCDGLTKGEFSQLVLESKVAGSIAQSFGLSRLRISDVSISCHPNGSVIDVTFRIADLLNVNFSSGNVANAPKLLALREIIKAINTTINAGNWSLQVNSTKKSYSVSAIKETLRLANETVVVNGTQTIIQNQTITGHSSGEMAGLAIAMLVVGVMSALFGVYLYQRRRNAQFSYMVQE